MQDITVDELKLKFDNQEDLMIIDVREAWEHSDFNLGGVNIPLGQLPSALAQYQDYLGKEIVVHCKTGARSAAAKVFMEKQGFTQVRSLLGGVVEWQTKFA